MKTEKCKVQQLVYGDNTEKKWKLNTNTLWYGIRRKNWQTMKMRNSHGRIWIMERYSYKRENWEIYTVGPGLCRENRKSWKMRHKNCMAWNMARNGEKHEKWEIHTVGSGIWWENWKTWKNGSQTLYYLEYGKKQWKTWKMRNAHSRIWSIARKQKNVENETQTLHDLEYVKKHWKTWKMRNAHGRNVNMQRKLTNKKLRNSHCSTWNMARNTEKTAKWETHSVGHEIWKKQWKT